MKAKYFVCEKPGCGKKFLRTRAAGRARRYCSEACQQAHLMQKRRAMKSRDGGGMKYRVVVARLEDIDDFECKVQALIDEGYEPLGGVFLSQAYEVSGNICDGNGMVDSDERVTLAQALVKK